MAKKVAVVWFRADLRCKDNPALRYAIDEGYQVLPVFILEDAKDDSWKLGGAARWWLHHSLFSLSQSLKEKGAPLVLRKGESKKILSELIKEVNADALFWNRCYEPHSVKRDKEIKEQFKNSLEEVKSFNASLLFEPWEIENQQGNPYKVYTAFWNATQKNAEPREPLPEPREVDGLKNAPKSNDLADLELLPKIPWDDGLVENWKPGETHARKQLSQFIKNYVHEYDELRNRPDIKGTSRISPYLRFGELSPFDSWQMLQKAAEEERSESLLCFKKELVWREFAYHLLFHFPDTTKQPLRPEFKKFPWKKKKKHLIAWQKGRTGYPIVDAGMRELWHTGWMHNRLRMIVASFLVKHLLIPWQEGADWFWDTLVDADLANNSLNWQWAAGCGADAAPYFRIFNPITQGEKFDPKGDYTRKWVPELSKVPTKYLFKPWEAPKDVLAQAQIVLGKTYPKPIVEHSEAREAALDAYEDMKAA